MTQRTRHLSPAERLAVVGAMATTVAHDIRNPLGSITLNLDLMALEVDQLAEASGRSPAAGHALIQEMRAEISRIQSLLGDYLQFARLPKTSRETFDFQPFLTQKLALLSPEMAKARVRLRTHFNEEPLTIAADPGQLWQALSNLLRNSREAMTGGGEISIAATCSNGQVLLQVMDTGRGMTSDELPRLFEPFFTTKPGGTGLGLALAHKIITEQGGTIECTSTSGEGTTFTIILPAAAKP